MSLLTECLLERERHQLGLWEVITLFSDILEAETMNPLIKKVRAMALIFIFVKSNRLSHRMMGCCLQACWPQWSKNDTELISVSHFLDCYCYFLSTNPAIFSCLDFSSLCTFISLHLLLSHYFSSHCQSILHCPLSHILGCRLLSSAESHLIKF